MTDKSYQLPPEEVDLESEERAIRRAGTVSLLVGLLSFTATYFGLPVIFEFPVELVYRIRFGILSSLFIVLWVFIAVGMVSTGRRKSAEDIGGSAAGPPSEKLAIKAAFLQNTLEQAVVACSTIMAWVVLVEGPWLAPVVVAVVLFALGRVLFYRGYPKGASGRAFGMSLTMTPAIVGIPASVVLVAIELVGLL